MGFPLKHKEFVRMVVVAKGGPRRDRVGDHYTARFRKHHPQITTTVGHTIDRDRVLAITYGNINGYFNRRDNTSHHNQIVLILSF
jgi:hypothetical protein